MIYKRILYINPFYSGIEGAWSTRGEVMVNFWLEYDCKVIVICARHNKSEKEIKSKKNLTIIRLPFVFNNQISSFYRILNMFMFGTVSFFLTLFLNFDQVFCSSGPIINTLPLFAAYLKGRKKIVEVRDIWPEILQITSIKIPRFIYQAMLHYAKWIYQLSERVIVLNEDAKQYLVNYYHHCKNKLHVIPQLPIELFKKSDWDQSALKKWNLEKGKYAIYAGNIGEVNAVFDLLEHAEYVYARENEFKLVLVGEGKLLNQIKSDTAMGRYPFLVITGLLNKSSTYALMENAFCHFVWLKNDKILETSSPNKFAESLLLGVPVIINVGGWMENYIEKNNSGKRSYTKAQTLEIIQNMLDTTHLKTDLIKKSALEFFQAEKLKSSYIVYQ